MTNLYFTISLILLKSYYSSSDMENTDMKKDVMEVNSDLEIFNDQKKKKKRKHKHHKHKRDKILEKEDVKIDKQDR